MFDIIIKNARVISGNGNPWYKTDIGIKDSYISYIGNLSHENASNIIDAEGLIVSPGFIDAHAHGDLRILDNPNAEDKLMQGVTTEINGQCGLGLAPIQEKYKISWREYLFGVLGDFDGVKLGWETFQEYLQRVEDIRPSINVGYMLPYGAVRLSVTGIENKRLNESEMDKVTCIIEDALKHGAFGVSLGLAYIPSIFASIDELEKVCRIVKRHGRVVTVHVRNEGNNVVSAIEEVILLSKKTGVSLHICHLKAAGKKNRNKTIFIILEMIEKAREDGLDITFDTYPYDAASTMLKQVLPPWALEGGNDMMKERLSNKNIRKKILDQITGDIPMDKDYENIGWDNHIDLAGWRNIVITSLRSEKNQSLIGKSIEEIAVLQEKDSIDVVCDLLMEEDGSVGMAAFMMDEEDVRTVIKKGLCMIGSDGLYGGKPHPRLYGTFPRLLGKYVRENKVISLEEAIRKITSLPAQRYGILDRGVIAANMKADIVIFNDREIIDKATFDNPCQYPEGIEYVIVNGKIAVEKGRLKSCGSGKLLICYYSS
jgi:N-acyl-D-amino-acid deacylase